MPTTDIEFEQQLASTASNTTINQFQKRKADGSLVLKPPYQRHLVWNDEQKSALVDSILRGLPVPEIYAQLITSASGEEQLVIVDGQQRISTCLGFLADNLRLVGNDGLDPRWRNRKFSELEESLRKRFRSYELIVRKLPDADESVLREIFRRLNKWGEPLVAQEIRHAAYTGEFISLVEAAGAVDVLTECGVFTPRDYLRRRNDELMAEIAFALVSRAFPNKKEGLDELFLTYEQRGAPKGTLEELERRFGRVFVQLSKIGAEVRRSRFRNKTDFYSLFILLAKNAEVLPLSDSASTDLGSALRRFSTLVNDIKREEGERKSIEGLTQSDLGKAALKYLRAVERAASDRLNRVRREEALVEALSPELAKGESRTLGLDDSEWRKQREPTESDEENDEDKARAQLVLMKSSA